MAAEQKPKKTQEELMQQVSDLELLNFSNERRIQELQRMLAKCKDEKHRFKELNKSLYTDIDALKGEIAMLKSQASHSADLEAKIKALKAELKKAQSEKQVVEVEKIVEIQKVEKDHAAISLMEAEYQRLQKAFDELKLENRALEHELAIFGPEARPHRRADWIECPIKTVRQGSTKVGFIDKAGKSRRGAWRRRFFILNQDCLFWYKADDSLQRKAKYLRLEGAKVDVPSHTSLAHAMDGLKVIHPFPFRLESDALTDKGKPLVIIFNAENEKERTEWVVALREAIAQAEKWEENTDVPKSPRARAGEIIPSPNTGRRDRGKSLVSQLAIKAAEEQQAEEKKKAAKDK